MAQLWPTCHRASSHFPHPVLPLPCCAATDRRCAVSPCSAPPHRPPATADDTSVCSAPRLLLSATQAAAVSVVVGVGGGAAYSGLAVVIFVPRSHLGMSISFPNLRINSVAVASCTEALDLLAVGTFNVVPCNSCPIFNAMPSFLCNFAIHPCRLPAD